MKFQVVLVVAALCLSVVVIPPGGAGLLIAIGNAAPARWATSHGAALLQAGALPRSVVIRVPEGAAQWKAHWEAEWDALRDGLLLVRTSAPDCSDISGKAD